LNVTKDEVWIGNWIYWTLTLATTNNYDSLTELHTPNDHCNYSTQNIFSVFTSRCLLAASKVDVPLPLGSLSYQLLTCHNCSSQLTQPWAYSPRYIAPPRTAQKTSVPLLRVLSLPGKQRPQSCSLATAALLSPVYIAVTWQWVYMPQYSYVYMHYTFSGDTRIVSNLCVYSSRGG
jgi:hypothetical protein